MSKEYNDFIVKTIEKTSPVVAGFLKEEIERQEKTVELIASENFPCDAVHAAAGSPFSDKYTEGYPEEKEIGNHGRYYGGCEIYDKLELYGIEAMQKAFNTNYYFNLQPHSGSSANCIAYSALMNPGDTILSMDMDSGAHLTHSSPVSFVSKLYEVHTYGTDRLGFIDYNELYRQAKALKPKVIMCGASAYPREIQFWRIKQIADQVGAHMVADIAHISGLVSAGEHCTPFGYADIVTFTTQKVFQGPRGGVIACRPDLAKAVDSSCFPRWQGGALQNQIAGKVIAAELLNTPEYKEYAHQVVLNAMAMSCKFMGMGYQVVTGGTENHMFLIDFSKTHPNLTGKMVQDYLDEHYITLNKNCVPGEKRSPRETSGVRIGLPAMTAKGWKEQDAVDCAVRIDELIKQIK